MTRVRITWVTQPGQALQAMTFDASLRETHQFPVTVTDHPVERGLNISDHLRPEPIQLELETMVTNHPLTLLDHVDGARETQVEVKGAGKTVGNVIGRPIPIVGALASKIPLPLPADTGIVKSFTPTFDRVSNILDQLLIIRNTGVLVTVITSVRTYPQMAITSFAFPRDAALGNSLKTTIQLKEVRLGSTTDAPAPVIPTKKADKGTKVPEETEDLDSDSTALFNAFGGE